MLQGDAKREYMRNYMRKKRAGLPTKQPAKPWQPTKRMRDQVRYWFRTGAPASHRQIIEKLKPKDEDEALYRYKAHLDERKNTTPPPSEPLRCSFCNQPAAKGRGLVSRGGGSPLICAACAKDAVALLAKRRRRPSRP